MGPEQQRTPGPPRYATRGISVCRHRQCGEEKGETSPTPKLMPDSALNGAERALQQSFRNIFVFNGLLLGAFVILAYLPIRALPDREKRSETIVALSYRPVALPSAQGALHVAGAWELSASDPRFAGLSGLAIDRGRFLAVSDLGAVVRFDMPNTTMPKAVLQDLRIGPGTFGRKWRRDAESLARDPRGRGWWVGYEQHHSLWLYDDSFHRALAKVDLQGSNWSDNRGAEGLIVRNGRLLVLAENGRDAVRIDPGGPHLLRLYSNSEVADAARAPDGSAWVLLRDKGMHGISQSIAPLQETHDGYLAGRGWPVPKAAFDNFEGMTIEVRPDGRWRFWLVTDDGHRVMARTLLAALDLDLPIGHSKGPATGAGPSMKPYTGTP